MSAHRPSCAAFRVRSPLRHVAVSIPPAFIERKEDFIKCTEEGSDYGGHRGVGCSMLAGRAVRRCMPRPGRSGTKAGVGKASCRIPRSSLSTTLRCGDHHRADHKQEGRHEPSEDDERLRPPGARRPPFPRKAARTTRSILRAIIDSACDCCLHPVMSACPHACSGAPSAAVLSAHPPSPLLPILFLRRCPRVMPPPSGGSWLSRPRAWR